MVPQSRHAVFSNVFVFNPGDGSLELAAKGGAAVHLPLQKAFCRSVLGIDVGAADPRRPAYRLDVLLDPAFTFVTDPNDRIARVFLRCVRIGATNVAGQGVDALEIKFPGETELANAVTALRHCAKPHIVIRHAEFELLFLPDAEHRVKKMSFRVTVPNTCNLKSKPDELRAIGQRCLKLWKIADG